jgi:hypothetical protein
MKIKTSELQGAALNWCVAQCEMMHTDYRDKGLLIHRIGYGEPMPPYSSDWAQGGPIIEREKITLRSFKSCWQASIKSFVVDADKEAPLTAAMRCYVASKLGDEVEIPEELI